MQEKANSSQTAKIELNAVIVAVTGNEPQVLVNPPAALPSGPFETEHRTLEQGLRDWAQAKGGQPLGYVECFTPSPTVVARWVISVLSRSGYLTLVRAAHRWPTPIGHLGTSICLGKITARAHRA